MSHSRPDNAPFDGHRPARSSSAAVRIAIGDMGAACLDVARHTERQPDYAAFRVGFRVLAGASFTDDREHYMHPILDALSRISDDRETGNLVDALAGVDDLRELTYEYLWRF